VLCGGGEEVILKVVRIHADLNSGGSPGHGACWLPKYGPGLRPLDEVAGELHLWDGMPVLLYYEERSETYEEEFEVSAVLEERKDSNIRWWAMPDWSTFRRIKGKGKGKEQRAFGIPHGSWGLWAHGRD
jgi:hypothetical protein